MEESYLSSVSGFANRLGRPLPGKKQYSKDLYKTFHLAKINIKALFFSKKKKKKKKKTDKPSMQPPKQFSAFFLSS
jgi:hypothetical protein